MSEQKKITPIIMKHTGKIAQLCRELSRALAVEGTAMGCIFVMKANGDTGLLFRDGILPAYALEVIDDMEKVIPHARKYWQDREKQ